MYLNTGPGGGEKKNSYSENGKFVSPLFIRAQTGTRSFDDLIRFLLPDRSKRIDRQTLPVLRPPFPLIISRINNEIKENFFATNPVHFINK